MIFSELYSAYYRTVSEILSRMAEGETTEKDIREIIRQYAFGESALAILPALKNEQWQLVRSDLTTPIEQRPTVPLTTLEKRWLASIRNDRRIKLFGVTFAEMDDIVPLFTEADYYIYDRYSDGDPYEDEGYIAHFRMILNAIRTHTPLSLKVQGRDGRIRQIGCMPKRLEYSEKDDKFRLITTGGKRFSATINLAKVISCRCYQGKWQEIENTAVRSSCSVTLEIRDERNALERTMMHFAHFEKEAEHVGKNEYRLRIFYDKNDESELVIRILSFGPMVKVTAPEAFVSLMKEKLKKQKNCGLL